jgi:hypothetical protein
MMERKDDSNRIVKMKDKMKNEKREEGVKRHGENIKDLES